MQDSPPPKTPLQIERELVVEMDRAHREYEQAAKNLLRAMRALQDSGIRWPDRQLDTQNLKAQMNLSYRFYRESFGRFLDFLQREVPKSRLARRGAGAPS
jgi:hypothetical protein